MFAAVFKGSPKIAVNCISLAAVLKANPHHDAKGLFTTGAAQNEDAAKWHGADGARQLPALGKYGAATTPLPMPKDGDLTAYHVRQPGDANTGVENAPVRRVSVAELVTGQHLVEGARLRAFDKDAPPIEVMVYQGVKYLTQGNHRAAAAWAAGVAEIEAKVLDLDDPKNSKYLKPKYRPAKIKPVAKQEASFASVLKNNPYRDKDGHWTTKDKAVHQGAKVFDKAQAIGALLKPVADPTQYKATLAKGQGAVLVKETAAAYVKYAKHTVDEGKTPEPVENWLKYHMPLPMAAAAGAVVKASMASTKAWTKIYQKKALDGVENEVAALQAHANAVPYGKESIAQKQADLAVVKKLDFFKNQYVSNGGDPAVFEVAAQKATGKVPVKAAPQWASPTGPNWDAQALASHHALAVHYFSQSAQNGAVHPATKKAYAEWGKANAFLHSQLPGQDSKALLAKAKADAKAGSAPPSPSPAAATSTAQGKEAPPTWKEPTGNNLASKAVFSHQKLGAHYYALADQQGKMSDPALAAYDEWAKAKEYLKKNVPNESVPALSLKAKAAYTASKAKGSAGPSYSDLKAKNTPTQEQAKQAMEVTAYQMAYHAGKDIHSGAYHQAEAAHALALQQALDAGMSKVMVNFYVTKTNEEAAAKVKQQALAATQMALLLKDKAQVLKIYDDHAATFKAVTTSSNTDYKAHVKQMQASLTKEERDAVYNYTNSSYTGMNKVLANGTGSVASTVKVGLVQSALSKSKLGMNVKLRRNAPQKWFWKAMGIDESKMGQLAEKDVQQYVGRTYKEVVFSSTSKDLAFVDAFSSSASSGLLQYRIRAHKDIRGLDVTGISSHTDEAEIVLDKNLVYVVRAITKHPGNDPTSPGGFKFIVDVDAIAHEG